MSSPKALSFFDKYADEYDLLTDESGRLPRHRQEVAAIIDRFHPRSVLDAGCGTGLTAMLFATAGIEATGVDRSRAMLSVAHRKYDDLRLLLNFHFGKFENLPKRWYERFDLVVCLANSISGVGSIRQMRLAFKNFLSVLKPGGSLVLQALNYGYYKEDTVDPIKATIAGDIVYQRFSERRGKRIRLLVTRLDTRQRPPALEVFTHESEMFTADVIQENLRASGFYRVRAYADLSFTKKIGAKARDVVITAGRGK